MTQSKSEKYDIPSILYEEPLPGQRPNPLPFINVAVDATMPPVLFIFENKDTGEEEVGDDGLPAKIVDQIPHKYVDMELLKEKLPPHINDMVRVLIGMQPLKEAQRDGQVVLDKVQENIKKLAKLKTEKGN